MRYLGNKDSLTAPILDMLREHNLLQRNFVFFDAFCGMGAVADSVKNIYNFIKIIGKQRKRLPKISSVFL